jgi:thiol-disulfide isomerase/thioredoxin
MYVILWAVFAVHTLLTAVLQEVQLMLTLLQRGVLTSTAFLVSLPEGMEATAQALPRFPEITLSSLNGGFLGILLLGIPIGVKTILRVDAARLLECRPPAGARVALIGLVAGNGALSLLLVMVILNGTTGERIVYRPAKRVDGKAGAQSAGSVNRGVGEEEVNGRLSVKDPRFPLPVPDVKSQTLSGDPFSLASYRGKVVLFEFWASWCAPCLQSLPRLRALENKFGSNSDFEIVSVCLDEEGEVARNTIERLRLPGTHLLEPGRGWENSVAQAFRVTSIPHTEVVSREGRGRRVELTDPALEAILEFALREEHPDVITHDHGPPLGR